MAKKKSATKLISRPEVIAFLRDAKDNPEDDTPRLILADWLEDHGDPRGEFLRLDMELAAKGVCDDRHAELLKLHEDEWLGPLAAKANWSWRRGLLSLSVHQRWLLGPTWAALAGTELWEWVEEVTLEEYDTRGLKRLADSPLLPSITSFNLNTPHGWFHSEPLITLLQSRVLWGLRELDAEPKGWNYAGPEVALGIAASLTLNNLKRLKLRNANGGPIVAKYFATSMNLARLETLDLANDRELDVGIGPLGIGPQGSAYLVDSAFLGRLRRLNLRGNQIQDEGIAILADSPFLAHIEELDISLNLLTDAGVEHLARSRHLSCLRKLDLSDNALGMRAVQALANCTGLTKLAELGLEETEIGEEEARLLASLPSLTSLRTN